MAAASRGSRQVAIDAPVARRDPWVLSHAVLNGRALGLGGTWGEGQSRRRLMQHVPGGCKTCGRSATGGRVMKPLSLG